MKELLEKYFNGETSIEEENQLKEYFRSEQVGDEMKAFAPLFQAFENESVEKVSSDFDERLFEKMGEESKVVRINTWRKTLMRIAAVGAVLLASYFIMQQPPENTSEIAWEKYEITDEDLAFEETKKALMLLSSKLNRGKSKASKEVSKAEKVTKYLN